jgi:hypothetical protein
VSLEAPFGAPADAGRRRLRGERPAVTVRLEERSSWSSPGF